MNYHNITHCDMLNGEGIRVVLWVAGCEHKCYNCQNPFTWDINDGIPFDQGAMFEICKDLDEEYCSGLTLTGGDPLHKDNRYEIFRLVQSIKQNYPDKDIWLYTGYTYEQIIEEMQYILQYIDVLVEGQYLEEQRDIELKWRGSSNQRVINVKETLKSKEIVLYCE